MRHTEGEKNVFRHAFFSRCLWMKSREDFTSSFDPSLCERFSQPASPISSMAQMKQKGRWRLLLIIMMITEMGRECHCRNVCGGSLLFRYFYICLRTVCCFIMRITIAEVCSCLLASFLWQFQVVHIRVIIIIIIIIITPEMVLYSPMHTGEHFFFFPYKNSPSSLPFLFFAHIN